VAVVRIRMEGADEFKKAIFAMGEEAKAILYEAANAGAEYALPKIKEKIPVDSEDNIHLRDTIRINKARRKKVSKQSAMIVIGKKSADYALSLETGHMTHGRHVEARPYIRPAIDENNYKIAQVIVDKLIERMGRNG